MVVTNAPTDPSLAPATSLQQWLQPFAISAPDIGIADLTLDSREVAIHTVFLAVIGHAQDGRDFIPQAISLGAKAIVAETREPTEHGRVEMREHSVIVDFYRLGEQVSALAAAFFRTPAQHLATIAVTGTNGKTSTVHFVAQLGNLLAGKVATMGTLGTGFIDDLQADINTTPDAIRVQRLLANFVSEGATAVAFEASSHALIQGRVKCLATDIAIFTNLSRDHLDYHGTMAAYGKAKRILLQQPGLQYVLLNVNDAEHCNWLQELPESVTPVLYGIGVAGSKAAERWLQRAQTLCARNIVHYCFANIGDQSSAGIDFRITGSWGKATVTTALLGEFNVSNLLAAITAQLCAGAELQRSAEMAKHITAVPGRMELFQGSASATFVVDYAHTPDALAQALISLRRHVTGRLWCVFGCGGERDQGKRPEMGRIAEQWADHILLTSDNSRNEATSDIIADIQRGMPKLPPQRLTVIPARTTAIQFALTNAQPADLVLLAGKGHETHQYLGTARIAYDERAYLTTLLTGDKQ